MDFWLPKTQPLWLLIPIFLGMLAGGLVNYLADVLPHTLRLG